MSHPLVKERTAPGFTTPEISGYTLVSGFMLAALFLLAGCSFNEPVMPTWSVPINVPLAEEVFQLGEELINDSTIVSQGADSLIYINIDGDLDAIELSSYDYGLASIDTTQRFEIGVIHLSSIEVLQTGPVSLRDIFPDLGNLVGGGQSIPFTIPDTTFMPAAMTLSAGDFQALHVVNGSLAVQFDNSLPFPIGPNAGNPDGIEVTIADEYGNAFVSFFIDEVVQPGNSVSRSVDLGAGSGTWVYSPMNISYVLPVAQATTFQLDESVLDNSSIEINVGMDNIDVDEAIAQVDVQNTSQTSSVALENDYRLRRASVESGSISLVFDSSLPLESSVEFTIPSLKSTSGQPYNNRVTLFEGQTTELVVDLAGMEISHPTIPDAFVDSLSIDYQTVTDSTSQMVHVQSTDFVSVVVHVDSLVLASFAGYIASDTIAIEPFEQDSLMDYEDLPSNIQLEQVDLALDLSNEIFIENMIVELTLVGYHKDEYGNVTDSVELKIDDQRITPGNPGTPGKSVIALNGPEVASFLNLLPTAIRTYGQVLASGNVSISQSAEISGSYHFSTPIRFTIDGDASVQGDENLLETEDIDQEIRDANEERFESATLDLSISNHTPIGGRVRLIVSADPDHTDLYDSTYFNPNLEFIKEIALDAAPTDPNSGYVTGSLDNQLSVTLTQEEFRLFQNPPLRIGYELRINDSGGVIALRATDFVKVSGSARIILNISDE